MSVVCATDESLDGLLRCLAARPNRFQVHAKGALGLRQRQSRRHSEPGICLQVDKSTAPSSAHITSDDTGTPIAGLCRPVTPCSSTAAAGTPDSSPGHSVGEELEDHAWDSLSSDEDVTEVRKSMGLPDRTRGAGADRPRPFERGITCDMPLREQAIQQRPVLPSRTQGGTLLRERRPSRDAPLPRPMTLDDILSPAARRSEEVASGAAEWPQDVLELLETSGDISPTRRVPSNARACAEDSSRLCKSLRLRGSGFSIPHPEKAGSGGADSYFVDPSGKGAGIADGVGEWEWRFGVNARAFADELMSGCSAALRGTDDAQSLLEAGVCSTRSFGSSTALVASLTKEGSLGVANLGDSALVQLRRRGADPLQGGWRCVDRTREQQHSFNCPYQLSLLPGSSDFPELLRQGKEKLVRAIERAPAQAKVDTPSDADVYEFTVQEGDLLVFGTDGVFDNLYTNEICELLGQITSPLEVKQSGVGCATDPAKIAAAIAKAAFHRSTDRLARTPFGDHAKQAGLYHKGGKMDDITCVCAWLVSKNSQQ